MTTPETERRQDFENIPDMARVKLFPNADNPLHKKPVEATYASGYFYCDGTPPEEWPDYYFGDVLTFNDGFEVLS